MTRSKFDKRRRRKNCCGAALEVLQDLGLQKTTLDDIDGYVLIVLAKMPYPRHFCRSLISS